MFDRVYTVGCFDYFHYGHISLLTRMKKYGKKLIVGIHDDKSIEELKNLRPDQHEPLETRMANVKQYADIVYVIPHKNPTFYVNCVLMNEDNMENACFIRGNDMPNFPGRDLIENKISIKFLEYTHGISSTQIRKQKMEHNSI